MKKRKYENLYRGDVIYANLGQHPNSSVQSGNRPCSVESLFFILERRKRWQYEKIIKEEP